MLHEGNRARRERQVWRSGVGFLLLSVILNTHTLVRSFVREPGTRTGRRPWVGMGDVVGREIIGRVDRHSIATRARPSERRSVRAVRFFSLIFLRRVRFRDGRTDGRSARSIEEGFKTRIVDQFFILGFARATDRFDPIRSDPTRSFASPVRSERCRTATRVGFISSR